MATDRPKCAKCEGPLIGERIYGQEGWYRQLHCLTCGAIIPEPDPHFEYAGYRRKTYTRKEVIHG